MVLFLTQNLVRLYAQGLQPIPLPAPQTNGGKPLMQALSERRTIRDFKSDKLPAQILANLLWAGFGINRPESGSRTAPSAMNSQEIDIYVALPEGLYLYDPKRPQLTPVLEGDCRGATGGQDFTRKAPLSLIFVADLSRLAKAKPETKSFYADFDAGCICQNIYLFSASEGLATVVHDLDRAPLAKRMELRVEQQIMFAQAVGYPDVGKK
jgi:nitroreductase